MVKASWVWQNIQKRIIHIPTKIYICANKTNIILKDVIKIKDS